eukprot:TRINITY_DN18200_c0_g1_i1.p1 TRINITY_DN18200_c0_g1~~TRINITY_DN18200_c0_g1_i1.p1  ORF type:complete len:176 (-),score=50.88 TRINITY_DN18200_c0_g1_i1:37-564(-)
MCIRDRWYQRRVHGPFMLMWMSQPQPIRRLAVDMEFLRQVFKEKGEKIDKTTKLPFTLKDYNKLMSEVGVFLIEMDQDQLINIASNNKLLPVVNLIENLGLYQKILREMVKIVRDKKQFFYSRLSDTIITEFRDDLDYFFDTFDSADNFHTSIDHSLITAFNSCLLYTSPSPRDS